MVRRDAGLRLRRQRRPRRRHLGPFQRSQGARPPQPSRRRAHRMRAHAARSRTSGEEDPIDRRRACRDRPAACASLDEQGR